MHLFQSPKGHRETSKIPNKNLRAFVSISERPQRDFQNPEQKPSCICFNLRKATERLPKSRTKTFVHLFQSPKGHRETSKIPNKNLRAFVSISERPQRDFQNPEQKPSCICFNLRKATERLPKSRTETFVHLFQSPKGHRETSKIPNKNLRAFVSISERPQRDFQNPEQKPSCICFNLRKATERLPKSRTKTFVHLFQSPKGHRETSKIPNKNLRAFVSISERPQRDFQNPEQKPSCICFNLA